MFLVVAKINDYVGNPRKKLAKIMPKLLDLQQKLQGAKFLAAPEETLFGNDPMKGLVLLLNSVSPWDDRNELAEIISDFESANSGQYDETIWLLYELNGHFIQTGRNPHGINRTERGQIITEKEIFLGDLNVREILVNHIDPMCKLIDQLNDIAK
jgi:hypothetical protein